MRREASASKRKVERTSYIPVTYLGSYLCVIIIAVQGQENALPQKHSEGMASATRVSFCDITRRVSAMFARSVSQKMQ